MDHFIGTGVVDVGPHGWLLAALRMQYYMRAHTQTHGPVPARNFVKAADPSFLMLNAHAHANATTRIHMYMYTIRHTRKRVYPLTHCLEQASDGTFSVLVSTIAAAGNEDRQWTRVMGSNHPYFLLKVNVVELVEAMGCLVAIQLA